MKISYDLLPLHMRDGARLYIEQGIEPGGFMYAVLINDFKGVMTRSDNVNKNSLQEWVEWLLFQCPATAQGSRQAVDNWIETGGLNGSTNYLERD